MSQLKIGLKEYFANIQVRIQVAEYIECDEGWKYNNFYPEHNKLYLICQGEGQIKVKDDIMYPKEGQMVLLPENQKQSLSYISSKMYKKYYCHFNATIGTKNLFDVVNIPMMTQLEEPILFEEAKELFEKLVKAYKGQTIADALKVKGYLLELLSLYFQQIQIREQKTIPSASAQRIEKVLRYVDEHISKELSVDMLAEVAHLQSNYFIRFFKRQLGCTPMRYVKERKLEIARSALVGTDQPIAMIGQDVGFKDSAHFSRAFKEVYGRGPKKYRQVYQDPNNAKVRYKGKS